jgi:hypothetical protein
VRPALLYAVALGRKEAIERMAELCGWSWPPCRQAEAAARAGDGSRQPIRAAMVVPDVAITAVARARSAATSLAGHNLGHPRAALLSTEGSGACLKSDSASHPAKLLASFRTYRQLSG